MLIQRLQRNADIRPTKVAITFGGSSISYAEYLAAVQRLTAGMKAVGIGQGDRVALILENSSNFILCFFAIAACGAINVPLSPESKDEELEFFFRDAKVKFAVVENQKIGRALNAAQCSGNEIRLVVAGDVAEGLFSLSDLMAHDPVDWIGDGDLDGDLLYLYSSGSTGRQKCLPRTVAQYWYETEGMVSMLRLTSTDVIFCAIPLFHNYGLIECMLAALASGARLVILEKPNPFVLRRRQVLKLLEEEKVTVFPGVPLMFKHLLDSPYKADLSALRMCYTAAAVLPRELFESFLERFAVPIRQHYGCAEVGALAINVDPDPRKSADSVGYAFPGVSIRVTDDYGRKMPIGEMGDVAVRSPAMTRGYLGTQELDKEAFKEGYFLTGDLGRLDQKGRLYLLGRRKFVIDIAGHKVDPVEVEDTLAEHECVKESVVVGVRAENGDGWAVRAYVVAERPCNDRQLMTFCRERLANFKAPQSVRFVSAIPRDALGKLVRKIEILEKHVVRGQVASSPDRKS